VTVELLSRSLASPGPIKILPMETVAGTVARHPATPLHPGSSSKEMDGMIKRKNKLTKKYLLPFVDQFIKGFNKDSADTFPMTRRSAIDDWFLRIPRTVSDRKHA